MTLCGLLAAIVYFMVSCPGDQLRANRQNADASSVKHKGPYSYVLTYRTMQYLSRRKVVAGKQKEGCGGKRLLNSVKMGSSWLESRRAYHQRSSPRC